MKRVELKLLQFVLGLILIGSIADAAAGNEPEQTPAPLKLKTRNILLVTSDGLRWQEVFGGADSALMNKEDGGVVNPSLLKSEFGGDKPEARRKQLMPFLWTTIAKNGQIFGNVDAGSEVRVTNGKNFSYPGYNEILTGVADPKITSNHKIPNQNVTVLEWLNGQDDFRNRIAVFGSWDVFPYIVNRWRSRVRVVAGWRPLMGMGLIEGRVLDQPARGRNAANVGRLHLRFIHFSRRARVFQAAAAESSLHRAGRNRRVRTRRAIRPVSARRPERRPSPESTLGKRPGHARLSRNDNDDRDHRPRPRKRPDRVEEPR